MVAHLRAESRQRERSERSAVGSPYSAIEKILFVVGDPLVALPDRFSRTKNHRRTIQQMRDHKTRRGLFERLFT